MKKIMVALFFLFLLLPVCSSAETKYDLKLVKSIGDNRNEYLFFKITSALISPDKEIFVGDSGGHFIAKYTWDGKFVKRIGQPGQGPGDFNYIFDLNYLDKKIYAYDLEGLRITVMNFDLEPIKFIKLPEPIRGQVFITRDENILCCGVGPGDSAQYGLERIKLLTSDGKLIKSFFSQTQFGELKPQKDLLQWAVEQWTAELITAYSADKSEIIISFEYPPNPVKFFVYDLEGKLIKTFNYNADKKYQFPDFLKSFPLKYPAKKVYYPKLSSIFVYKSYYLAFINYWVADKGPDGIEKSAYLIFDQQGNFLAEKELDQPFKFFHLTSDGYLIGTNPDDEIPKVLIYQLLF
ncbi:MAG: 6-bladed beta-propeller [Candidatus Saccharicenans sp.]|nr:6-bladed beta-propeller [Candidatus Saccharicenans sp.]